MITILLHPLSEYLMGNFQVLLNAYPPHKLFDLYQLQRIAREIWIPSNSCWGTLRPTRRTDFIRFPLSGAKNDTSGARGCLPVLLFISRIFHRHKSRDRRQASGEHSVAMAARHPGGSGNGGKRDRGRAYQGRGFNPVEDVWEKTGKVNKSSAGLKIIPLFCNIASLNRSRSKLTFPPILHPRIYYQHTHTHTHTPIYTQRDERHRENKLAHHACEYV